VLGFILTEPHSPKNLNLCSRKCWSTLFHDFPWKSTWFHYL